MRSRKVMIIDDDKDFLGELEEVLNASGYDMVAVDDALAARDIAIMERPAVILMDLKMPKKSGFELASDMRQIAEMQDIPIIAMSAYFKDDFSYLLDICNIRRCLKKPFYPLDVITEIESVIAEDKLFS